MLNYQCLYSYTGRFLHLHRVKLTVVDGVQVENRLAFATVVAPETEDLLLNTNQNAWFHFTTHVPNDSMNSTTATLDVYTAFLEQFLGIASNAGCYIAPPHQPASQIYR